MPTITLNKKELFRRLEKEYSHDDFDELCFEFGIELDDDNTDEIAELKKKGLPGGDDEPSLKIEIPANRYDLLCMEGLARGLRMFVGLEKPPVFKMTAPAAYHEVFIEKSTQAIRPFFASAVLHLAKPFDELSYASFIDLQDKLHQNLCRQRKLVAIGTHDLDTIEGPFRYMARDPKQIKFAPLNKDVEYTAEQLMTVYESDRHLSRYLPIIRDAPEYPIIYDSKDRVLSMPPIINSQHSKITMQTQNIFIDVTATDKTKLDIVVNMVVTMFAEYCKVPFEVEPVKVHYPDGSVVMCPDLSSRNMPASVPYINAALGLQLQPSEMCDLLVKMGFSSTVQSETELLVSVPPTRPDIIHECDLMEDVGIAYGFNKLPRSLPVTNTVAKPLPVNKLGDLIRKECAMAGWTEVLPLILCSHDENFAWLNRKDESPKAVRLLNPATQEFQIVRTSLLPGLLKTLRENKSLPLPLRIFECSDIAVVDQKEERRSRNYRHLGALYSDKRGGFEVVQGLLDRLMQVLEVPFIGASDLAKAGHGYYLKESQDATYFPGRGATIYYRSPTAAASSGQEESEKKKETPHHSNPLETVSSALKAVLPGHKSEKSSAASETASSIVPGDIILGTLGILHPTVLNNFSIVNPCSALEINVEPFL